MNVQLKVELKIKLGPRIPLFLLQILKLELEPCMSLNWLCFGGGGGCALVPPSFGLVPKFPKV